MLEVVCPYNTKDLTLFPKDLVVHSSVDLIPDVCTCVEDASASRLVVACESCECETCP